MRVRFPRDTVDGGTLRALYLRGPKGAEVPQCWMTGHAAGVAAALAADAGILPRELDAQLV